MVVSPLLVLMQNQIEAARQLGLNCDALNNRSKERRAEILESLKHDQLDLILITPETLFRDDVQQSLNQISIGLFVVDEAHCISDWGHDFRLEYGDLKRVIARLPHNVPVLATTATANDRVVNAFHSFAVKEGADVPRRVLLVDDIVDSRWTLTACGYRLMECGCQEVYPFALADSSQYDGG